MEKGLKNVWIPTGDFGPKTQKSQIYYPHEQ